MCPVSKEPFRTTGFHLTWTFSFWFQSTWTIHIKCYPVLSSKECGTDDIPCLAAMPTSRRTLQEIYRINFPVISVTDLNFMIENTLFSMEVQDLINLPYSLLFRSVAHSVYDYLMCTFFKHCIQTKSENRVIQILKK